jgi:hypothetical protein
LVYEGLYQRLLLVSLRLSDVHFGGDGVHQVALVFVYFCDPVIGFFFPVWVADIEEQ